MQTLDAAVMTLRQNIGNLPARDHQFARDLINGYEAFGSLTERQAPWVYKLVDRATKPRAEQRETVNIAGDKLVAFFDRASAAGLKYPKVKMTAGGEPLVISRAGEGSRTPGALQVTDGGPYRDNVWYGRVERDGTFTAGRACTPEVVAVLRALAVDPARTAAAYGQRTGSCCMCRRHLEDYRSVSVGYGPICAEKWGLPWGEVEGNPSEYSEKED